MTTMWTRVRIRVLGGHVLFALTLTLTIASDAAAQRAKPLFGPRIDFNPGFRPVSVSSVKLSGEEGPLLLVSPANQNQVLLYGIEKTGKMVLRRTWPVPSPVASVLWEGGPARGQVALFSPGSPGMQITLASGKSSPINIPVPPEADRFAFADVTNDKLSDLLFFGKQKAGITMNRGTADGFSGTGVNVLGDLSASDLVATDLNGDLITDLFVADWLSNKLVLYLGIGGGIFSEQVSVLLPGEPSYIAFHAERQGKSRIAVSLPDLQQIQVFVVNALGEFTTESVLPCPGPPGKVVFSDIDGDDRAELLSATEEELVVFTHLKGRFHRASFLYAAGGMIADWTIADIDNDRHPDVVLATHNPSGIVLLGNSAFSGSIDWPPVYSVGPSPQGLASGDFNGDGREDVAVVSSAPGNLCLLLNRDGKRMDGPIFTPVGDNPVSVKYVAGGVGHSPTFVLSHFPSTHVTVLRETHTPAFSSFEIPTALNPIVLFAEVDSSHGKLSFLTRNRGDQKKNLSLSLFDEVSEEQFIETSLQPNPLRRVTSITAFDMNGDGKRDLIFSSFEKNRGKSLISFSRGVDRFSFSPHKEVFSLTDTVGAVRFIRAAFIDNDARTDIVVVLGPPMTSVLLLYGTEEGVRDSVEWIRGVNISGEDALVIADLNGDGSKDLCFVDLATGSVVALNGMGNGTFRNRRTILEGSGVTAISSGSFTTPGITDLVVSNQKNGTVTFLRNPF